MEESNAFFIPTALHALPGGAEKAARVICGTLGDPFCQLGWKSLSLLELTTLSTVKTEIWMEQLATADALLVGGGDCQYLCYWMQASGLLPQLPAILRKTVYVGLSAGSMIMGKFGTTYGHHLLPPDTAKSLGWVDFGIHPHLDYPAFPNNSLANLEKLANSLDYPSYLIDDQTAIRVINGKTDIVSEGNWKKIIP